MANINAASATTYYCCITKGTGRAKDDKPKPERPLRGFIEWMELHMTREDEVLWMDWNRPDSRHDFISRV